MTNSMRKNKLGNTFANPIVMVSALFTLLGLFICFSQPLVGLIILLICAFVWSSHYGIELNITDNKYREYSSVFGLKRGEWKPLTKLPDLTIMHVREGMKVYSRSNRSTTAIETKIGVYLLSASHRRKVLVQKFDEQTKAKKYAEELSQQLNKEIVTYNPMLSDKTRNRRR